MYLVSISHSEAGSFFSLFVNHPWSVVFVSVCLPLQLKRCVVEEGLKQTPIYLHCVKRCYLLLVIAVIYCRSPFINKII